MKIFTRLFCLAAGSLLAVSAVQAVPAGSTFDPATYLHHARAGKAAAESRRSAQIERINALLDSKAQNGAHAAKVAAASDLEIKPSSSMGPTHSFGDIDGPNGEVWFYTMDLENEEIKHEYFSEYKLLGYTINIYDGSQKLIGTIKDKMDYGENEKKVPLCDVLPTITRHFFNNDNKYEVAVGLAINTMTPGILHYRTVVYQLDGEKGADGDDVIVSTLPEMVCDVLDATVEGGPEKVYMSTMSELFPTDFDENGDMWEYRLASKVRLQVYGPAGATDTPRELLTYDICHQNLPGNQETSPFLLTLADGDKAYVVFSQYKETLFEPYRDASDDLVQRADNSLKIDVYELSDQAKLVQETVIPFTKDSVDGTLASFYSVGDCSYRRDINFHDYDNTGKAAFIITKGNKTVASDELLESSYYIYNHEGARTKTLFEGSESLLGLSDIPGCEPQMMFVTRKGSEYFFNFVDLISCKTSASLSQYLKVEDSDPDPLLSNLDRTPAGKSYQYVFEMRYPTEEEDCAFMRIAWINADGSFDHIDEVNIGSSVRYAKCLIESKSLSNDVFHSDKHREYLILIKRGGEGGSVAEEFIIGQARSEEYPDGRTLLYVTPDSRGVIETILPYTVTGTPLLAVAFYSEEGGHILDFYSLPFDRDMSGIGSTIVGGDDDCNITVEGNTVSAQGCTVELYSLQGIRLAAAAERLDISSVPAGAYIVKAGESAKKIIKK